MHAYTPQIRAHKLHSNGIIEAFESKLDKIVRTHELSTAALDNTVWCKATRDYTGRDLSQDGTCTKAYMTPKCASSPLGIAISKCAKYMRTIRRVTDWEDDLQSSLLAASTPVPSGDIPVGTTRAQAMVKRSCAQLNKVRPITKDIPRRFFCRWNMCRGDPAVSAKPTRSPCSATPTNGIVCASPRNEAL